MTLLMTEGERQTAALRRRLEIDIKLVSREKLEAMQVVADGAPGVEFLPSGTYDAIEAIRVMLEDEHESEYSSSRLHDACQELIDVARPKASPARRFWEGVNAAGRMAKGRPLT